MLHGDYSTLEGTKDELLDFLGILISYCRWSLLLLYVLVGCVRYRLAFSILRFCFVPDDRVSRCFTRTILIWTASVCSGMFSPVLFIRNRPPDKKIKHAEFHWRFRSSLLSYVFFRRLSAWKFHLLRQVFIFTSGNGLPVPDSSLFPVVWERMWWRIMSYAVSCDKLVSKIE